MENKEQLLHELASPEELAVDEAAIEEPDTYYDFGKITRLSSWARTVSFVFLGLLVLLVAGDVFILGWAFIRGTLGIDPWFQVVTSLVPILSAGFFCVLLQIISEAVYVLLDIEDNTRQAVTLLENRLK